MPTPSVDVGPALLALLEIWREVVEAFVRSNGTELDPHQTMRVAVHLLDQTPADRPPDLHDLFDQVQASAFAQRDVRAALTRLLDSDSHLRAACRTTWGMASALQNLALDDVVRGLNPDSPLPNIEPLAEALVQRLFETDYRRGAFFHAYNVDMVDSELKLPMPGVHLVQLSEHDTARLVNEATPTSNLHHEGLGNTFVRVVDAGASDDWAWLRERWDDAGRVVRVLQYLKYGIADLDWAALHFEPDWVNEIRKYGIYMLGRPRRDVQAARFTLDAAEQARFVQYLTFYLVHLGEIDDMGSELRKASSIAGRYYESHHSRISLEDQLIDLVISLEALFSPESELRFRIAQRGALLVGADPDSRRRIFRLLRRAYDARSSLVHGAESPFEAGGFSEPELRALGEQVRVAILRMLTLHMRGHRDRPNVLGWLDDAALDSDRQQELLRKSDFEQYLTERDTPRSGS